MNPTDFIKALMELPRGHSEKQRNDLVQTYVDANGVAKIGQYLTGEIKGRKVTIKVNKTTVTVNPYSGMPEHLYHGVCVRNDDLKPYNTNRVCIECIPQRDALEVRGDHD